MDVFDLKAVLSLDSSKYESGLTNAKNAIGGFLGVTAKVGTAALGAAATGITALTKQSVSAYANYEQLTGGIETLYKDSADKMMEYAKAASTTTGQSMNDFMDAAISTSAAMITSVGGDLDKAADMTNMSMVDMADNVNKLGTNMESVQNAYRGFSRGNFTMLDNLALGFAGTKEGMQQLLDQATAISGVKYDISSYSDIVEAIHVVQTEMDITGTTSREASTTIQGSLGALSASWQNLVTGLSDPKADLGLLIEDTVSKAETALGNLVPVIENSLSGIASLVEAVGPIIEQELPVLLDTLLPPLLSTATSLIVSLLTALPSLLNILTSQLPTILGQIFPAILETLPMFFETTTTLLVTLAQFLAQNASEIIPGIVEVINIIASTLMAPEFLVPMIEAALQIISQLGQSLAENTPVLIGIVIDMLSSIIASLIAEFPNIISTVKGLLEDLSLTVMGIIGGLVGMSFDEVKDAFNNCKDLIKNFGSNAKTLFNKVKTDITSVVIKLFTGIKEKFSTGFSNVKTIVTDSLDRVKKSFTDKFDKIKETASGLIEKIKGIFKFDWKLPNLKLPHISVKGGKAPYGIAGQGSLPKFDIKWYKKAYDDAYILRNATIFGASGGSLLGGGEGNGSETIVGTDLLINMMGQAVANEMSKLQLYVVLDDGTLVGKIAPKIDKELGRLSTLNAKGVY